MTDKKDASAKDNQGMFEYVPTRLAAESESLRNEKDAQVMIEYLQEQNRKLTTENERLRKDEEEAAAATSGCHNCTAHEQAANKHAKLDAQKELKIESLELRAAIYRGHGKRFESLLWHAEERIETMRPIYEYQIADPDYNFLKICRVDEEVAVSGAQSSIMGRQLAITQGELCDEYERSDEKDQMLRNLGRQILLLHMNHPHYADPEGFTNMLLLDLDSMRDLVDAMKGQIREQISQILDLQKAADYHTIRKDVYKDRLQEVEKDLRAAREYNVEMFEELQDYVDMDNKEMRKEQRKKREKHAARSRKGKGGRRLRRRSTMRMWSRPEI